MGRTPSRLAEKWHAFLASDEASWVTGEVIQIHGGSRIPIGYLSYLHHINEKLGWEDDQ